MDPRILGSTLPDVSALHELIPHFTCGPIAPTSRSIRVTSSQLSKPWSKTGRKLVDPNLSRSTVAHGPNGTLTTLSFFSFMLFLRSISFLVRPGITLDSKGTFFLPCETRMMPQV